jgi:antitoxin (DNA-binding transcriptional repressor) of toxin-antitoxin stability system
MTTTVTTTELARNLSEILNRVRYKGERFRIERKGELIATLEPAAAGKARTVRELLEQIGHWRMPEGMADDIEQAREALGPMPDPPTWPS